MIQPIKTQILFEPLPSKEITDGGIFIPDSCKKISNKGIIKAVGSKVTKVKQGQLGYRTKDWGVEVIEDGVIYFLMNEDAILATD